MSEETNYRKTELKALVSDAARFVQVALNAHFAPSSLEVQEALGELREAIRVYEDGMYSDE